MGKYSEPAFPLMGKTGYNEGMTMRDYFAGQALAGMTTSLSPPVHPGLADEIAKAAYAVADAMLKAREAE
jgi:hypothetical protein